MGADKRFAISTRTYEIYLYNHRNTMIKPSDLHKLKGRNSVNQFQMYYNKNKHGNNNRD